MLFRVESGVGLSHSSQNQRGEIRESIGNLLNAKQLEIEARSGSLSATHTDFTSRDENGKRIAGSEITLKGKQGIELQAGESHYKQQGKNQSYGTEVGTAFSVGAKTGWSFYAKEGFSKGKQESEGKTYHNSHIDTDTLNISSGKDTALIGATAKAKTIYADIKGHLHIESQQDEHKQNSKQFGLGTKVEFGFGSSWEFSGNASAEGGKSNSKQVNEQAGLFAEEGGYHISADNVHLKGGVIASTNAKNSELTTNKLTFENINNSANYGATSGAISGGYSQSGTSVNPSLPMHEQGEDSTTTKATLTEGKITLNKDSQPTETTAAALGINTDLSQANKQVEQPKDVNRLLKEQKEISANVGHIATAASNFSNQQAKEAEAEKRKAGEELAKAKASGDVAKIDEKQSAYNEASIKAEAWGEGGSNRRKVDATVAVVGAILAGKTTAQAAVAAVSSELNAQIHELTKDSKTANLFAHAALSAAEFYAAGLDPASGALAGVVGEGSAMLLAEKVFNKQPSELTAEEKGLLKAASQLAGAIAGGVAGNSTATAVEGMATAKRAVENNSLAIDKLREDKKADAEKWKQRVRDKLGKGTASQFVNGVINVVEETADGALFVADGAFDVFATLTTCAIGDSYCNQGKKDLSGKSQAVSESVNALMNGEYWDSIKATAVKASQGDQKALEDFSGILTSILVPAKFGSLNKANLTDFSVKVPREINSGKNLPVVGEVTDYEIERVNISTGAENMALYPKLKASLIGREISDGHAFLKHVVKQGEFKNVNISTREQFEKHIENVINNYTSFKELSNGRSAYWHEESGTVVIRNPKAKDGGTAFQPKDGRKYFDEKIK